MAKSFALPAAVAPTQIHSEPPALDEVPDSMDPIPLVPAADSHSPNLQGMDPEPPDIALHSSTFDESHFQDILECLQSLPAEPVQPHHAQAHQQQSNEEQEHQQHQHHEQYQEQNHRYASDHSGIGPPPTYPNGSPPASFLWSQGTLSRSFSAQSMTQPMPLSGSNWPTYMMRAGEMHAVGGSPGMHHLVGHQNNPNNHVGVMWQPPLVGNGAPMLLRHIIVAPPSQTIRNVTCQPGACNGVCVANSHNRRNDINMTSCCCCMFENYLGLCSLDLEWQQVWRPKAPHEWPCSTIHNTQYTQRHRVDD